MDGSTATVLGTFIGALGGLSGGWLTVLGQGRQQRAEHARWRDEVRRDAYTTCISASKQLSAAWWKMADLLADDSSSAEQRQAGFVRAHDAWTEFSGAVAAVAVVGPRSVADAADAFRQALYEMDMVGLAWYEAARAPSHDRVGEFNARFVSAATAKRQPDKNFQIAARAALNTET
ncbi:hypothetical protein [Streptomyces fulvoviolaceus]|uniref:hypothetical protein n=1 Tax=Streptomyces fulvoviolaceus TaxID=285535 RepID=UPI0021BF36A5|nr:hypothetical protein [Streptomyces fulvoviolaceus]MCT9075278.1 hypothetical protein [Streptomyces fulvoviolaceus]